MRPRQQGWHNDAQAFAAAGRSQHQDVAWSTILDVLTPPETEVDANSSSAPPLEAAKKGQPRSWCDEPRHPDIAVGGQTCRPMQVSPADRQRMASTADGPNRDRREH